MIDDSCLLRENTMIRLIRETAELLFSADFIDGPSDSAALWTCEVQTTHCEDLSTSVHSAIKLFSFYHCASVVEYCMIVLKCCVCYMNTLHHTTRISNKHFLKKCVCAHSKKIDIDFKQYIKCHLKWKK